MLIRSQAKPAAISVIHACAELQREIESPRETGFVYDRSFIHPEKRGSRQFVHGHRSRLDFIPAAVSHEGQSGLRIVRSPFHPTPALRNHQSVLRHVSGLDVRFELDQLHGNRWMGDVARLCFGKRRQRQRSAGGMQALPFSG